jgi:hypothetical protein
MYPEVMGLIGLERCYYPRMIHKEARPNVPPPIHSIATLVFAPQRVAAFLERCARRWGKYDDPAHLGLILRQNTSCGRPGLFPRRSAQVICVCSIFSFPKRPVRRWKS